MSDLQDSINPLSLLDGQGIVQRRVETPYMMISEQKQLRSDNVTCSFCLRTDFDLAIIIHFRTNNTWKRLLSCSFLYLESIILAAILELRVAQCTNHYENHSITLLVYKNPYIDT